jgi:hypothetical protein
MSSRPRTFEETVAAQDPQRMARLANGERCEDQSVSNPFQREVIVHEDCEGTGDGLSTISTTTGAAMSRFSPARKPKSGRAIISMH